MLFPNFRRIETHCAIITGAASGIGRELAERLIENDIAALYLVDRDLPGLLSLKGEFPNFSRRIQIQEIDITLKEAPDAIAKNAAAFFKKDDMPPVVLFNCAGVVRDEFAVKVTQDEINSILAVNAVAPYLLATACVRQIWKGKSDVNRGAIVNITSISPGLHLFGQSAYAGSKALLANLTLQLATEYARKGIVVNAVAPGFVKTPMTEKLSGKHMEALAKAIPNGELFCNPEDVVNALIVAAFMPFFNAQTITLDNGLTGIGLSTMHQAMLSV